MKKIRTILTGILLILTLSIFTACGNNNAPADEAEEKTKSDNFMRALLTQAITADAELEDYVPAYANPAINFATDDMGSDDRS